MNIRDNEDAREVFREELVGALTGSPSPDAEWVRIYSDDVEKIPNLLVFARKDPDGACRTYALVGLNMQLEAALSHQTKSPTEIADDPGVDYSGSISEADLGLHLDWGAGDFWIEIINFQRNDPRVSWNGMTTTALIEVLKHHLDSFNHSKHGPEGKPGGRWSARAISALEDAGNYLRQRLRWRQAVGVFGRPGSGQEAHDALGNIRP